MNLNSVLNESKYDESVENLLTEIGNSYANWNPNNNADRVNQFRSGLKINSGRKFDKVIEKGRVWGFIAKKAGVFKGHTYECGDVFKAASWNAPAKWVRGSIFDGRTDWFSWTGPNYL